MVSVKVMIRFTVRVKGQAQECVSIKVSFKFWLWLVYD